MLATLLNPTLAALDAAIVRSRSKPELAGRQVYLLDRCYLIVRLSDDKTRALVDCTSPTKELIQFTGVNLRWVDTSLFDESLPTSYMSEQQFEALFG